MPEKKKGYWSKLKKIMATPGQMAADANKDQKGMSAAQKRRVQKFKETFTGSKSKKKK